MGSIYQPCFNTHCCWCSPCSATKQPGCTKYISVECESYKQGCRTSDGEQWFSWPPNKSLTPGMLATRDTTPWQRDWGEQCPLCEKWSPECSVLLFTVFDSPELGSWKGPITCQRCVKIRVLPGREEIGWLVLHSGNCLCPRLPDTGGAPWTNLSHIRSWAGQE